MSELVEQNSRGFEVKYELTFKRNLGNFENVDITVGLTAKDKGGPADADRALKNARLFVEDRLATAVEEVTEALKGN